VPFTAIAVIAKKNMAIIFAHNETSLALLTDILFNNKGFYS